VPHVEAGADELARQIFEQLGIRRRIAGADVVEWLDDADAGEITPQPVDVAGREEAIVRARDPRGELLAAAALCVGLRLVRQRRLGDFVRAQMIISFAILHDLVSGRDFSRRYLQ
jgi:hypothetical protein